MTGCKADRNRDREVPTTSAVRERTTDTGATRADQIRDLLIADTTLTKASRNGIMVDTDVNGAIHLRGRVNAEADKQRAEDVARSGAKGATVVNDIVVTPPPAPSTAPTPSSSGTTANPATGEDTWHPGATPRVPPAQPPTTPPVDRGNGSPASPSTPY